MPWGRVPTAGAGRSVRGLAREPLHLVVRQLEVDRAHGVADALGPGRTGDRHDARGEGELPREGHLLRADVVGLRHLGERAVPAAEVAGLADAAERAPRQERDAELGAQLELRRAAAEGR